LLILAAQTAANQLAIYRGITDPCDYLRQSLVKALRINNPRWLGEPDEPDRG
jgi:hypothetical protein